MCGLVGVLGPGSQTLHAAVASAAACLSHRGPDRQQVQTGDGWALGFRRLSILDLSPRGDQPMSTPDGRFHLVFNGEIYNYRELRLELQARGIEPRSDGDAEVVLCWLAEEGPAALRRFNGMFALCVVDGLERTFLLARDRLGVKPLYLRVDGPQLSFASELKALLALPDAPRDIDELALVEYLALGYLGAGSTIMDGYRKLPPGTWLRGHLDRPGSAREHRYWHVEVDGTGRPWDPDELTGLLEDAVRIRLRSDVPVGVFLSGGIDSGLVAALAAQAVDSGDARPLALTVGFPGADRDESELARRTALHTGLPHRVVEQRSTALADVDRLAWHFDEPFGDPSALATFALCEAAAAHGRVFLSGDGGDEAFGGYRRYVQAHQVAASTARLAAIRGLLEPLLTVLPRTSVARFRLRKATLPDQGFAAFFDTMADDPVLERVLAPWHRSLAPAAGAPVWDPWTSTSGRDLTDRQRGLDYALYLPDDVLVKVDRASMAHSVEVRSPLLDYRLVERAATVPSSSLLVDGVGKQPLRALAGRLLPPEVANARKRGFGIPVDEWFRTADGQAMLEERLLGAEAVGRGLWDRDGVATILRAHRRPRGRRFGTLLWRLLMLDAWCRHFVDDARAIRDPAGVRE